MSSSSCILRRAIVFAVMLVACTRGDDGGDLPVVRYSTPEWTTTGDIVSVGGMRVLSDGRSILLDLTDRQIWLFSSGGAAIRTIGSQGAGPLEFRRPIALLAAPGDSTLVLDNGLRRLLLLDPDGTPVRTIAIPASVSFLSMGPTTRSDGDGRIVTAAVPSPDSATSEAPLIRWDWRAGRIDTIARVAIPQISQGVPRVAGGQTFVAFHVVPYTPRDWYHPLPDGGVMIVRAVPYRVDVVGSDPTIRVGAPIPFTPLEIVDAERSEQDPSVQAQIPKTKPAHDGLDAVVSSDGEAWVRRMTRAQADSADYDVFSAKGTRLRIVRIPVHSRVLAVTATHTYIRRINEDDFQVVDAFPHAGASSR